MLGALGFKKRLVHGDSTKIILRGTILITTIWRMSNIGQEVPRFFHLMNLFLIVAVMEILSTSFAFTQRENINICRSHLQNYVSTLFVSFVWKNNIPYDI